MRMPLARALAPARARGKLVGRFLVFGGMETAGAGAETHVATLWIVFRRLGADPYTSAAMDTFFLVELRDSFVARCDGLSRAHLDTKLVLAVVAE